MRRIMGQAAGFLRHPNSSGPSYVTTRGLLLDLFLSSEVRWASILWGFGGSGSWWKIPSAPLKVPADYNTMLGKTWWLLRCGWPAIPQCFLRAGGPIPDEERLTTSVFISTRRSFDKVGSGIDWDETVVVQAAASTTVPGTFLHGVLGSKLPWFYG